jgi:hypothetical protein
MDEPSVISARLTQTAKDTVDEARAIAKVAIADAADVKNFTAAKAIDSYTKAAELAVSSGMQAARDVMGIHPPAPGGVPKSQAEEGRRLVADAVEAISRRMLRQSGKVFQETADAVDKNPGAAGLNPNGPSVWAKALVRLGDIALLGSIELAETALIGPAPFEKKAITSDTYPVGGNGERRLKVAPGGIARPSTIDPIPEGQIRFYVPGAGGAAGSPLFNGKLAAGQNEFYLAVNPAGMISGMYIGDVDVVELRSMPDGTLVDGDVLETLNVEVPL